MDGVPLLVCIQAAELCQAPIEAFMVFAGRHEVALHYGPADLEQDRQNLERLNL
jgi:predicted HTH domain antitoxin